MLVCLIAIPLSVHAGWLSPLFSNEPAPEAAAAATPSTSAADHPLLATAQNPNPTAARGGAEVVVEDNALKSSGPVGEDEISASDYQTGEIRVYTVQPGDTLSEVAEMFDVTANTILWANDLSRATAIQPGDSLVILPIAGVRHTVTSGDTMSTIAEEYDGNIDEILEYNQLASADELRVGDELIIPGGDLHSPAASSPARPVAEPTRITGASAGGGFSHPVPGAMKTQGIHGYNAIDLAAGHGTAIRAAAAGEVIISKRSGWNGGYGRYIVVRHANGTQTLYAHLSRNDVGVGAYVGQGEVIGGMGSTGRSTGTHLHFEVRGARNPF